MNNNMNKSPVSGKRMNNTIDKKEERRFQEERRDVMKMDKMLAGLIAFVAGVALSAGSALAATNGYMGGDAANMKLIPYYETGDMKATIIGIQNMSPQETQTRNNNADVSNIKSFLAGQALSTVTVEADRIRAISLINAEFGGTDITAATVLDPDTQLNLKAAAEKALGKAEAKAYVEHFFLTVNVYDAMGVMMDDASATLCLSENQFGVVVLQGAASMGGDGHLMQTLSAADGDIAEYGYVEVVAGTRKYTGCVAETPDGLSRVDNDTDPNNTPIGNTNNMVSTWTIIQDTGDGFFGTEVPSATIMKAFHPGTLTDANATDDDGAPELACYNNSNDAGTENTTAPDITPNTSGNFQTTRCGLIPERDFVALTGAAPNRTVDVDGDPGSVTVNATATARYDAGDDTMVYVWLAKGGDTEKTLPKDRRMLSVTVVCEDGMMPPGPDRDGDNQPDGILVAAPGMLTMVDPIGDELSAYTDQCEGDRGVLKIEMPNNSHAGMVFSHVQQMMGHYRMNFPGYSAAPSGAGNTCTTASSTSCQ